MASQRGGALGEGGQPEAMAVFASPGRRGGGAGLQEPGEVRVELVRFGADVEAELNVRGPLRAAENKTRGVGWGGG